MSWSINNHIKLIITGEVYTQRSFEPDSFVLKGCCMRGLDHEDNHIIDWRVSDARHRVR